tara:strand:+ start:1097 stop:4705 length:3609 start_codon:yes stop_codon:yes gene_type:complete
MSKRMLVNAAQEGEVRVATIENSVLEDLNVATEGNELLKGNLYKGVVVSVESGLQAAFVDYGADRNGFITFNDIHRQYYNKKTKNDGKRLRIQDAIAPGAELLVQVHKEEVGNKGAALTTDITQPGRYLVLMPFSDGAGVSRKIESESARKKLKEIVSNLNVPEPMGVIVRTAGQDRTKAELIKDYQALVRSWGHSQARYEQLKKPGLVYREPDVVIRSIRDYFTDDVAEIVVDNDSVMDRLTDYFDRHAPDVVERVKRYKGKMPLFSNYGLEKQLENISSSKVGLPSGGSIVINPTEALIAIDVNSGKSRGQSNQEEMAVQTNLEAADEAARQLRLRDFGGLVVIDFIDMYENKHRRQVEKKLKEAMKRDKARVEVGRISRFGLLELSRQRVKARLLSSTHTVCPMCEGSGYVMSTEVSAITMLRRLQELAVSAPKAASIRGRLPVPVALNLLNIHRASISEMESNFNVTIEIIPEIGAVSTRDAFEIITRSMTEKQGDDQRNDRRERRDRGRGRKRTSRSDNQRNDSERSSRSRSNNRSESEAEQPYEPPKVVGFLEPDQFNEGTDEILQDSKQAKQAASDDAAETVETEKPRERRRRRGRGRRGESDQNQRTPSNRNHAAGDADDAEQKRIAARERNKARRDARKPRTAEPKQQASVRSTSAARDLEKPPVVALEQAPSKSQETRDQKAGQTNRRAANRIRNRLVQKLKTNDQDGPRAGSSETAEPTDLPQKDVQSEKRSNPKSAAKAKETAKARLQAKAKARSGKTQTTTEPETKSKPETQNNPKAKQAQTGERVSEKSDSAQSQTAADLVKAKLKGRTKTASGSVKSGPVKSTRAKTREVNKKANENDGVASTSGAAASDRAAEVLKAKIAGKIRVTARTNDSNESQTSTPKKASKSSQTQPKAESKAAKPSRTRRPSKTTTKKATDTPASASEATTAEKPKRTRRTSTTKKETVKTAEKADTQGATAADDAAKPRRTRTRRTKATATATATAPATKAASTSQSDDVKDEAVTTKPKRTRSAAKKADPATAEPARKTRSRAKKADDVETTAAESSAPKAKRTSRAKTSTAKAASASTKSATAKTSAASKSPAKTTTAGTVTADEPKPTAARRTRKAAPKKAAATKTASTTKKTAATKKTTGSAATKTTKATKATATKTTRATAKKTATTKKAVAKDVPSGDDLAREKAASVMATLGK